MRSIFRVILGLHSLLSKCADGLSKFFEAVNMSLH